MTAAGDTLVRTAAADTLVPPGHGTLRQDEVTLALRSEALLIKVTPLPEWIIRLLAPDTYERLAGLARAHQETVARQISVRDPLLIFVSFFSYAPNVTFEPEDLQILSYDRRFRPLAIVPVTAGWGIRRLAQQETQIAVYAFDPSIDLRAGLVVEYRGSQNAEWEERIIPKLDEERAKVRARASPAPRPRSGG
ncbi:MAG: hypothetical protein HY704_17265 [Gemmatimonadetes bacterium]|nr:hypothetical protein [Gemmatimonadota bacterium]